MSKLEEYKASIVFTADKRTIVGKKFFDDKDARTFSHMIIAAYNCKDGRYILDQTFQCNKSNNSNTHLMKKVDDSSTRYSGQIAIEHSENGVLELYTELDTVSFGYVFDLIRNVADLLQEEKDEIVFEVYLYFVKH